MLHHHGYAHHVLDELASFEVAPESKMRPRRLHLVGSGFHISSPGEVVDEAYRRRTGCGKC